MNYGYKDPRAVGSAARIALIIWLCADTVYVASSAYALYIINAFEAGNAGFEDLDRSDNIGLFTAAIFIVVNIVCIIIVACWIYRTNKNAHALSFGAGMTVSPGWSVGWFFIPFANLWKPYEGIAQTWRSSVDPTDPLPVEPPGIFLFWWISWLVSGFVSNIIMRLSFQIETLDDLVLVNWLDILSSPLDFAVALSLMWIVDHLTRIQFNQYAASDSAQFPDDRMAWSADS